MHHASDSLRGLSPGAECAEGGAGGVCRAGGEYHTAGLMSEAGVTQGAPHPEGLCPELASTCGSAGNIQLRKQVAVTAEERAWVASLPALRVGGGSGTDSYPVPAPVRLLFQQDGRSPASGRAVRPLSDPHRCLRCHPAARGGGAASDRALSAPAGPSGSAAAADGGRGPVAAVAAGLLPPLPAPEQAAGCQPPAGAGTAAGPAGSQPAAGAHEHDRWVDRPGEPAPV